MADYILATAEVEKRSERGIYGVVIRERDSEVIPDDEKKLQFWIQSRRKKMNVTGPIFLQYLSDEDHANWRDRFIDLHMAAASKTASPSGAGDKEKT